MSRADAAARVSDDGQADGRERRPQVATRRRAWRRGAIAVIGGGGGAASIVAAVVRLVFSRAYVDRLADDEQIVARLKTLSEELLLRKEEDYVLEHQK